MTDVDSILDRIKRNRIALDECKRHLFSSDIPGIKDGVGAMLGQRMQCKTCGGFMGLLEISQYVRGYAAAGRDPNEIMPGWSEEVDPNKPPSRKFFAGEPQFDLRGIAEVEAKK